MTVVNRYLVSQALKFIAIVLAVVAAIYVCVDFFEKIDNFMDAGVSLDRVGLFFLFNLPFIAAQVLPVCVLLAVLITFGLMSRNNEIVALKSSGMSVYSLLRPIVALGAAFTMALFFFSEWVVPVTAQRANAIWMVEVKGKAAVVSREKNIWIRDTGRIIHIGYYNAAAKTPFDITVYEFDDAFNMVRRLDARRGVFQAGGWLLYKVLEQERIPESGEYAVHFNEARFEPLGVAPEDLRAVTRTAQEMSVLALRDYVREVAAEGYDVTRHRVDLHGKIAFPFICLILSLVGTGIALRGNIREGIPVSVAYGLGVAFLYWVFYSFCMSLGYGGILPPVIAAWTANVVFFSFGAILLLNAE